MLFSYRIAFLIICVKLATAEASCEVATCGLVDKFDVLKHLNDESVSLDGKVTVIYNVAPPKPYLTVRIYRERDPIYFNNIKYDEQIELFFKLQQRFLNYGFKNVQFLLTASPHRYPYDPNPYDFEEFYQNVTQLAEPMNTKVFKNTLNKNNTFSFFGLKEFQVVIVDKCSRLSYIIEPPWSLIEYSYVKAGILSTMYDMPCGECDAPPKFPEFSEEKIPLKDPVESESPRFKITMDETSEYSHESEPGSGEMFANETENNEFDFSELESYQYRDDNDTSIEDESVDANDTFAILPLKITLPLEHVHYDKITDTFLKYNYVTLKTGDPEYHEHDYANTHEVLKQLLATDGGSVQILQTNWTLSSLFALLKQPLLYYNEQNHNVYRKVNEFNISNCLKYDEIELVSLEKYSTERQRKQSEQKKLANKKSIKKHYEHLIQWLTWQFK